MSTEEISLFAGALLSLIFSYVPGLKTKFNKLDGDKKRLVMLSCLLIVPLGALGLSCIGRGDYFPCTQDGVWQALTAFLLAAVANQTAYALTPKG